MQLIDDGNDLPTPQAASAEPRPEHASDAGLGPGMGDLAVTLSLDDLLPDANGEVVIIGAAGDSHLSIVTEQQVSESGIIDHHVTADGYDVGGLAYHAFESGTTLFYPPDLALTIAAPESC